MREQRTAAFLLTPFKILDGPSPPHGRCVAGGALIFVCDRKRLASAFQNFTIE